MRMFGREGTLRPERLVEAGTAVRAIMNCGHRAPRHCHSRKSKSADPARALRTLHPEQPHRAEGAQCHAIHRKQCGPNNDPRITVYAEVPEDQPAADHRCAAHQCKQRPSCEAKKAHRSCNPVRLIKADAAVWADVHLAEINKQKLLGEISMATRTPHEPPLNKHDDAEHCGNYDYCIQSERTPIVRCVEESGAKHGGGNDGGNHLPRETVPSQVVADRHGRQSYRAVGAIA
jgi:hypothetical protein